MMPVSTVVPSVVPTASVVLDFSLTPLGWSDSRPAPPSIASPWRINSIPTPPASIFSGTRISVSHPRVRYNLLSSTLQHQPLPISGNGFNAPAASSREEFDWNLMNSLFTSVASMISNSVCYSTQRTYQTGWKRWLTYIATVGTDRYLQMVPAAFNRYVELSSHAVQMSWAILACCGFLAYLVSHPTKPTSANTATKYLAAVR